MHDIMCGSNVLTTGTGGLGRGIHRHWWTWERYPQALMDLGEVYLLEVESAPMEEEPHEGPTYTLMATGSQKGKDLLIEADVCTLCTYINK